MDDAKQDMNEQTRKLVVRAQEGDQDAFASLYRLYANRLEKAIRRNLGSKLKARMESDDLIQSAWKDLLPDLKRFEYQGPDSFFRWFSLKVIRKIRDKGKYFARGKRNAGREVRIGGEDEKPDGLPSLPSPDPTPSQAAMRRENIDQLMGLLDHLPDLQRQTLVFRLRDNMEFDEIAEALQKTPDAARKIYDRALNRINELIDKKPGRRRGRDQDMK
jgi:RNA polymerase sigma-70 factor (ECF subfamily)